MHNSGQGCKVTQGDRTLRERRAGRETGVNWLLWIFLRWRLRGNKNMCTDRHTVILTPLSLPDLRVTEVRCVILMNKNHTDTPLVKMKEEKYLVIVHLSWNSVWETERSKEGDRLGVSSTCFQLNRSNKSARLSNFKNTLFMSHLEWTFVTSTGHSSQSPTIVVTAIVEKITTIILKMQMLVRIQQTNIIFFFS